MKKDWLAAIVSAPAILLDILVRPFKEFIWEEKQVLEGAEYDPEADYQEQGAQEADS